MADDVKSAAVVLCDEAASQISAKTDAGEVDQAVVAAMVNEKIARRTELLLGAVRARKAKVKALGAVKPAIRGYNADGSEIAGDSYTLAQVERIKSLKKDIEELDTVIDARNFDKMSALGF